MTPPVMAAFAIAKALGGAKKAGGGWLARCPVHEDKHSSLSLTDKEDKLLWKCHAGCSQQAVQEALQDRGLLEARVERHERRRRPAAGGGAPASTAEAPAPANPEPPKLRSIQGDYPDEGAGPGLGKIVATYDYVDVTGQLLFQVCRFEPKTFRQRRPKGKGWEWGLGRTKPLLYRLPTLADAASVFVVEGEKDADNLASKLDVVTTCSPMGAGKWRDEFADDLAGKHVFVIPDNDEPGRKHAGEVALSCHKAGCKVRWLELPGVPEKGDVSDWLAMGHTKEDLRALAHAAQRWRPEQKGGNHAWEAGLLLDEEGNPLANEANLVLALEQAPQLAGRVRYEQFFNRVECKGLPWDGVQAGWRPWTDTDTTGFAVWAQKLKTRINVQPTRVFRAVDIVARGNPHHAPRAYLSALKWDGEPRIDDWLETYLGAKPGKDDDDAPAQRRYLKAIGPKFLISAVARIFQPGCKVDTMLVAESPTQGKLKSTAIKVLFGGGEWFTDHISAVGTKDSKEELAGKWCIEVSELSALQRGDVEKIKAFLSTAVDNYRPSYGHLPRAFPRQCVFFGSTNEDAYLRDATGGRRFWPFKVGTIDIDQLTADRDQLWAEAADRYHQGDKWHLTPEEEALAGNEQKDRVEPDVWGELVDRWLATGPAEISVITALVDAIKLPPEKWDQRAQNRVAQQFKLRGMHRRRPRIAGDSRRPWVYE